MQEDSIIVDSKFEIIFPNCPPPDRRSGLYVSHCPTWRDSTIYVVDRFRFKILKIMKLLKIIES